MQNLHYKRSFNFELFSLKIVHRRVSTYLSMKLFTEVINTKDLPNTKRILKTILPSIFYSKCFNERNLPFSREVKCTEIGHLFEHIMLEYLCRLKLSRGFKEVEFEGLTRWNWYKEEKGTFHITINSTIHDREIFFQALGKSIALINFIFREENVTKRFWIKDNISMFVQKIHTSFYFGDILTDLFLPQNIKIKGLANGKRYVRFKNLSFQRLSKNQNTLPLCYL